MNYGLYIKKKLKEESDCKYKDFSAKLTPTNQKIIGARIPYVKSLAKETAKREDWLDCLKSIETTSLEETIIYGCIAGYAKTDNQTRFDILREFIPKIDNWASCDTVVSTLKFMKRNQTESWNFLRPYFESPKEFEVRFAFVSALCHFINKDYLKKIFDKINTFSNDGYYAKMAVAWTIATAMAKYKDETLDFLRQAALTPELRKMTCRKITDSFRIDNETKDIIKNLK